MRKLEKIKRILNKWKDVWVYIENFNKKELLCITWYTKHYLVWYWERPFKLPIQQARILVFKK